MNDKTPRERFEELTLPRREVPKMSGRYRVYKDTGGYITVEATSALEAFKQSGLPQVRRIERDAIYLTNVLNLGELLNTPAPAAPTAAEAPVTAASAAPPAPEPVAVAAPAPEIQSAATAPVEEVKPVAPPVVEAPLSTSDVDKLLKGDNTTGA